MNMELNTVLVLYTLWFWYCVGLLIALVLVSDDEQISPARMALKLFGWPWYAAAAVFRFIKSSAAKGDE